jgi:hypothetical protein
MQARGGKCFVGNSSFVATWDSCPLGETSGRWRSTTRVPLLESPGTPGCVLKCFGDVAANAAVQILSGRFRGVVRYRHHSYDSTSRRPSACKSFFYCNALLNWVVSRVFEMAK